MKDLSRDIENLLPLYAVSAPVSKLKKKNIKINK